jgi:hypothetical protein
MRQALRWFFNAATIVSLLLCVASTWLWARSRHTTDRWVWDGSTRSTLYYATCISGEGRAYVRIVRDPIPTNVDEDTRSRLRAGQRGFLHRTDKDPKPQVDIGAPWFYIPVSPSDLRDPMLPDWSAPWFADEWFGDMLVVRFSVRWWHMAIFFALLPMTRLLNAVSGFVRRRHRAASGACTQCGYDLRATPNRCPECGTPAMPLDTVRKRTG